MSMMDEAFKLWAQIEEESGTELYMYVVILQDLACSVIFETVLAYNCVSKKYLIYLSGC